MTANVFSRHDTFSLARGTFHMINSPDPTPCMIRANGLALVVLMPVSFSQGFRQLRVIRQTEIDRERDVEARSTPNSPFGMGSYCTPIAWKGLERWSSVS